jgi:transcriptional regulator of acetoin/glycerol metabolism
MESQDMAEGPRESVSFREMVNVVDEHYPKYYAELSGSDISDKQFEQKIINAYKKIMQKQDVAEDWQKANKRDKTDGMSQKAVNAYRRENPGSKLKTAVTTKPSKLKKGGKASKRRKSYCSRSRGQMKMHSISCAKTPDKAICKARRRWNC